MTSERRLISIQEHLDDDRDERAVLGALLSDTTNMMLALGAEVDPALFGPATGLMFSAACALLSRGAVLNVITMIDELRCMGKLADAGGQSQITNLASEFSYTAAVAGPALARMRHKAAMRLAMEDAMFLSDAARNWGTDTGALAVAMIERGQRLQKLEQHSARSKWEDVFSRGALTGKQLRDLEIIPRLPLVSDWLCESDLGFLFAARGIGKTWLALFLAIGVADGCAVGPWKAVGSHPVLYVDGEMPLELIQTRNRILAQAGENLHYINHEQLFDQTGEVLNLTDGECQRGITALCLEWKIKLLVLDNLSCLFRGVSENDADAWERILPWLLELRRRKIAVLFVVHAGRNGQMRGTSRREDAAAWVIRLDDATDATSARTGAKFVSSFTKPSRNTANNPPPLEWSITTNASTGAATVAYKQAEGTEAVLGWVRNGLSTCSEIAVEMGVSNGTVSKLATKLVESGKLRKCGRGYALADENGSENDDEK